MWNTPGQFLDWKAIFHIFALFHAVHYLEGPVWICQSSHEITTQPDHFSPPYVTAHVTTIVETNQHLCYQKGDKKKKNAHQSFPEKM